MPETHIVVTSTILFSVAAILFGLAVGVFAFLGRNVPNEALDHRRGFIYLVGISWFIYAIVCVLTSIQLVMMGGFDSYATAVLLIVSIVIVGALLFRGLYLSLEHLGRNI